MDQDEITVAPVIEKSGRLCLRIEWGSCLILLAVSPGKIIQIFEYRLIHRLQFSVLHVLPQSKVQRSAYWRRYYSLCSASAGGNSKKKWMLRL